MVKTNNKALSLIVSLFLLMSLFPIVSAVNEPSKPSITIMPDTPTFPVFQQEVYGKEAIAVDEPSNHDWVLKATDNNGNYIYPDRDTSDLNYSWMYGIFVILDSEGNPVYHEGPEDLGTLNKYEGKVQYTFSEPGTYYYTPAIVEVKQEFKNGTWQKTSEEIVAKEQMKVNVAGEPGEPEVSKIGQFFDNLWNWIKNIFK